MDKKLERRIAYYTDGSIDEAKTVRKTFKTDNLVGIIAFYSDGTREEEITVAKDDSKGKMSYLANLQYKHDGGLTPDAKEAGRKS